MTSHQPKLLFLGIANAVGLGYRLTPDAVYPRLPQFVALKPHRRKKRRRGERAPVLVAEGA